jgi:hypothetical protein
MDCGSTIGVSAYAEAAYDYPFIYNSPNNFVCGHYTTTIQKPMAMSCSLFRGQQSPCRPGTHNTTGSGPEGNCFPCPSHLESSFAGSMSPSECFTKQTNLFVASEAGDRVLSYDSHNKQFGVVRDGVELSRPRDIAFFTETEFLFTTSSDHSVKIMDIEGKNIRDFAQVLGPTSVMYLPEPHDLVAVISLTPDENQVIFFSMADYAANRGVMLEESDIIAKITENDILV